MVVMKKMRYFSILMLTTLVIQLSPTSSNPLSPRWTDLATSDVFGLRQSPLAVSQFSLAATRFIVMLPFLPLLMAVPSATAVALPLFMAMQDRLKTLIPNLPTLFPPSGGSIFNNFNNNNNNNDNNIDNQDSGENPSSLLFRRKRAPLRSPTKVVSDKFKEVLDLLYKTDDVLNQLTSNEADCRRQAVCRLHHSVNPSVGSFLGNVMQVMKLESQVEKLDVSPTTRTVIKDVIKAASSGLYRQDCAAIYSKCSILVPPTETSRRRT